MYVYTDKNSHGYAVKYPLIVHGYSIKFSLSGYMVIQKKNSYLALHGYSMKFSLFDSSWL